MKHILLTLKILIITILVSPPLLAQSPSPELAKKYYAEGSLEKARETYSKLARKQTHLKSIHEQYFMLLIQLSEFQLAFKHIDKMIKLYPSNSNYKIDKGRLIGIARGEEKANQYYIKLKTQFSTNALIARRAAYYYLQNGERDQAIALLLFTRERLLDSSLFALDLASIYKHMNKKSAMTEEYIRYANVDISNLQYVKNSLQVALDKPEDIADLETSLFQRIQEEPENVVYIELLIWANLQNGNYNSAFIQARALDKRLGRGGNFLMEIGEIALSNEEYKVANKIFDYIQTRYLKSNLSIQAEFLAIINKENQIKSTYPINKELLGALLVSYQKFINLYSTHELSIKASLRVANIQGYFLEKKQEAILLLTELIATKNMTLSLRSETKLTLADIFLLNEEPWEARLLYAQVDKTMKETPIGYIAKLKRAQLAYYQGDFELSQAILDILKLATSREIANDALDLSLFIKENSLFDSQKTALKVYASLELLLYQHKNEEVIEGIDTIITKFRGESLEDDFILLKATELKKSGDFIGAANTYAQITENFGSETLADKSLFLQAEIYELYLKNMEKAKDLYIQLLKEYPGSIYVAESRKRYRKIRSNNTPEIKSIF